MSKLEARWSRRTRELSRPACPGSTRRGGVRRRGRGPPPGRKSPGWRRAEAVRVPRAPGRDSPKSTRRTRAGRTRRPGLAPRTFHSRPEAGRVRAVAPAHVQGGGHVWSEPLTVDGSDHSDQGSRTQKTLPYGFGEHRPADIGPAGPAAPRGGHRFFFVPGHSGPGRAQRMPRSPSGATVPASSAPQLPCVDQRWCRRGARRPSAPGISSCYAIAGALRFESARPGLRRSRSATSLACPRPLWPGSHPRLPSAVPTRLHRCQRGSSFRPRASTDARADAVAGHPNGRWGPSPSRRSLGTVGGDQPLGQGQQVLPQLHRLSHHEGEPQVDQEGGCPIQPVGAESEPGLLPS